MDRKKVVDRKKIVKSSLAVLIAGGTLFGGSYWWNEGRFRESTDNAYVQSEITPIAPKVSGYVAELLVEDNMKVQAGDILLKIEDTDFRAKAAEAQANLAARRAALVTLEARIAQAQAQLAQVAADVGAAEAEAKRSGQEYARANALLGEGHITKTRYDLALADRGKADSQLARARAGVEAARRQVAALVAERGQAEALIEQAEAQLVLAENDLANTVVRAPVAGLVGNRAVRTGAYVRPGTSLLSLVPLESVWIDANFKETQLARMGKGQDVEIKIDAYPGRSFRGQVDSLSPASGARFSLLPAENASGNFVKIVQRVPVKIRLESENGDLAPLRPGMSAIVTVDTKIPGAGGLLSAAAATMSRR